MNTKLLQHCAPKNMKKGRLTCFNRESLEKIAEAWNQNNPNNKIDKSIKDDNKLWKSINDKLKNKCSNDVCWLTQDFMKKVDTENLENDFKPTKPTEWNANKFTWLNTLDIQNVLEQYQENDPSFFFVGAVPIDFDKKLDIGVCVVDELCNINLEKLYNKGIRKIGVVFNLDAHDEPGSHWVSLFLSTITAGIYYIDSVGQYPPDEIAVLMKRLQKQGNEMILNKKIPLCDIDNTHEIKTTTSNSSKKNNNSISVSDKKGFKKNGIVSIHNNLYKIVKSNKLNLMIQPNLITNIPKNSIVTQKCFLLYYNHIQHQQGNTECGVYSIYFLTELALGKSYKEIIEKKINYKTINEYRNKFFKPNNL